LHDGKLKIAFLETSFHDEIVGIKVSRVNSENFRKCVLP
jgi:hypothetical protein